jgi:hypothetical protein
MKLMAADRGIGWNGGQAAGGESMHSVIISAAVGLLAFAMGLVGLYLKRLLPERHMSMGSRDMIGAIMGLLSLLLALVLGGRLTSLQRGPSRPLLRRPRALPIWPVAILLSASPLG